MIFLFSFLNGAGGVLVMVKPCLELLMFVDEAE